MISSATPMTPAPAMPQTVEVVTATRNWVDAAYFAITSTTTVAYGDLIPTHEATKIFLIFYLPVGIGVGFTVLASIGAKVIAAQRASLLRTRDSRRQRPNPRDDAPRP